LNESNPNPGDLVRIWSLKENEAGDLVRVIENGNELGIFVNEAWGSDYYYNVLIGDKIIIVMSDDVEVLNCEPSKSENIS